MNSSSSNSSIFSSISQSFSFSFFPLFPFPRARRSEAAKAASGRPASSIGAGSSTSCSSSSSSSSKGSSRSSRASPSPAAAAKLLCVSLELLRRGVVSGPSSRGLTTRPARPHQFIPFLPSQTATATAAVATAAAATAAAAVGDITMLSSACCGAEAAPQISSSLPLPPVSISSPSSLVILVAFLITSCVSQFSPLSQNSEGLLSPSGPSTPKPLAAAASAAAATTTALAPLVRLAVSPCVPLLRLRL
ncbi:hypothetical protein Emed_002064 [Eimeria media]